MILSVEICLSFIFKIYFISNYIEYYILISNTRKGGFIIKLRNIAVLFFTTIIAAFSLLLFRLILFSNRLNVKSNFEIFNLIVTNDKLWICTKYLFVILLIFSNLIIFNFIFSFLSNIKKNFNYKTPDFGLLIGKDSFNNDIYIPEKSLYQNILITGSIGSGKTASAMYPFTKQLINYKYNMPSQKLGFLILDVKGNYYKKVLEFANIFNRVDDVIVLGLNGNYKYNPLDKPDIKSSVLANRIKSILLLFSPNNSESYWLDKVEQILECFIDFCRIYNDGYVSFDELHKLTVSYDYYIEKLHSVRLLFNSGNLSHDNCFLLHHLITFLESDYFSLDNRTHNLIKSEITRITNCFVSDYDIKRVFCPTKDEENFYGFNDVIENGKIVVLNMNIAEYRNLSKIMSAYLKLDFQTEVLRRLAYSSTNFVRPVCFISDEYQEYVTSSDADFYSQSREAKCINIVSTQSYTSILNALNNQNATKVIIQNLINKLWFRTDDKFTIDDVINQVGKEDKKRLSKTFSENSRSNNFDRFSGQFMSVGSSLSTSINSSIQHDFVYDSNFFTQDLETFSCLAFLSNGSSIMKPIKLKMMPYFESDNSRKD